MMESNKSKGGRPRDKFAYPYVIMGKDKDGKLIKTCTFCGHQFSIKTSVTRIKAHLGKVEKQDVILCTKVPFDVEEAARNAMPSSSSKRLNANIPSSSDMQQSPTQECYTSSPPPQLMQSTLEQCPRQQDNLEFSFLEDNTSLFDLEMLENFQSIYADTCSQIELVNAQQCFMNHETNLPQEILASQEVPEVQHHTPQPNGNCSSPGTLASQHPMQQHLREDPNCFPGQELLRDSTRMDSTHMASIPHDSLQEGGAYPNSLPQSAHQEDMPVAELNYQEGLESQHHHMQEYLQGDQRVGSLNQNLSSSIVSQMHHVHIDTLHGSLDTHTFTLDQAKHEKKRKFLDRRPIGKTLPLGRIFQGPTFRKKVDEICESLENDSVTKIGVYGMGGSGKTTIMKFIHNLLLEGCFMPSSHVIWITVSQDRTISQLQHHLASLLKVELSHNEDEVAWATTLYKEMQKKRYALILDDVWDKINLEEVGIPEPSRDNGCKLVLTTRSLDICRRMKCETIFLDLLSEEEAWELFVQILDVDPKKLTMQGIVKEVARECARLPLAIVTVAGSMCGIFDVHEWRDALDSLRNRTHGFTNMKDQVMESLKFSYYRLSEQLQSCLVNCALYPEDKDIYDRELIEFLIMEGTIGSNESRKSAYDRGRTILNKLESACLLTRVAYNWFVIHDLIRDMCLEIMGGRFLVKCSSKSLPEEPEYTEVLEKVSLMDSKFKEIPMNMVPNCPMLSTLLLSQNVNLTRISDSFFMEFPKLKVLNLSGTSIQVLPSSITKLESLNALVLQRCHKLRYLSCLTPLKALKQLDLWGSGIKEALEGLEGLVNLTYLDLGLTDINKPVSSSILTNLVKLQYLKLPNSVKIMMKDVKGLKKLEVFEVVFANWEDFSEYVNSGRVPSKYDIEAELTCLGASCASMSYRIYRDKEEGRVEAWLCLREDHNTIGENRLSYKVIGQIPSPKIVEELWLQGLGSERHQGETRENVELKGIFGATVLLPFSNLVKLRVGYLDFTKDLISASSSVVKSSSSPKVLPCFQNLQVLWIRDCESLESILVSTTNPIEEEESNNPISFPNLRQLYLIGLPNLRSIYEGTLICLSIEYIRVYKCPKLKRLPLQLPASVPDNNNNNSSGQLSSPPHLSSLKEIRGESEWWESLEWDQPHAKALLQPYFSPW